MHQCPTCGKQLDDSIRFCPDDGTPLTETAAATSARTPTGPRSPSKHIDLPTVVGQRYRLVEFRGGGGMAKVYRAVDLTLEREVAVKLINQELRTEAEFDARFQREARIASQLADPHIVVVHDFGIDTEHGPFLVMEYLKGQSLRERLQVDGPLPFKAALQLAGQLLLALVHAHEKGIVHRDIKPDNVFLLSQSGVRLHVRVLDFGIARIYRQDASASGETLTQPGAVLGTPRYMSPEQLAGQPIDTRSDLYTAAVVIHEALTAQLPYVSGKKLSELCPEAPSMLQDLLDYCLKPNPQERPRSALEVYMRLNELGKASGVLLLPPGALDKLLAARHSADPTIEYVAKGTQTPSSRRWLVGGVLILLLAAAAIAAVLIYNASRPPAQPPARESVLDLTIGMGRDALVAALGQAPEQTATGDPWNVKPTPPLGHVLKPAHLGIEEGELAGLDVLTWSNREVCVILHKNTVRAVVVHAPHRAATARELYIGDSLTKLERYYLEQPEMDTFEVQPDLKAALPGVPLSLTHARGDVLASKPKPRSWGKMYRYDALGIGFELQNEKVSSIVLYPPKSP